MSIIFGKPAIRYPGPWSIH